MFLCYAIVLPLPSGKNNLGHYCLNFWLRCYCYTTCSNSQSGDDPVGISSYDMLFLITMRSFSLVTSGCGKGLFPWLTRFHPHGLVEESFPNHLGRLAGWIGCTGVYICLPQLCASTQAVVTYYERDRKVVRKIYVWSQPEECGWLLYFLIWETIQYNPGERDLFLSLVCLLLLQ